MEIVNPAAHKKFQIGLQNLATPVPTGNQANVINLALFFLEITDIYVPTARSSAKGVEA
jgi:hypothetical protein